VKLLYDYLNVCRQNPPLQTDGRTETFTLQYRATHLRASRGKNRANQI